MNLQGSVVIFGMNEYYMNPYTGELQFLRLLRKDEVENPPEPPRFTKEEIQKLNDQIMNYKVEEETFVGLDVVPYQVYQHQVKKIQTKKRQAKMQEYLRSEKNFYFVNKKN